MWLPNWAVKCDKIKCVYMKEGNGLCEDPECNSRNSDAKCFGKPIEEISKWLIWTFPPKEEE